ncbi:uncharacterized protein LOC116339583 isoform X1 [Contarinia nasturtii]|uniref:uncharacterized protein LOC116339583 isoform X1 n=1 Tax=Contarinia nasturtii TaxID=265458 RepID=UPI0012D3EF46|nr:uncharacterized protein LOC116339583 isoform X1 [Contarinia nasturtii]
MIFGVRKLLTEISLVQIIVQKLKKKTSVLTTNNKRCKLIQEFMLVCGCNETKPNIKLCTCFSGYFIVANGLCKSSEAVDALKIGTFPDDDKPLKCYVLCVIDMTGVLSRKKEFIESKMETQARVILPPELQEFALNGWDSCRTVPKQYKDPCDRVYYTVKCTHGTNPSKFTFA